MKIRKFSAPNSREALKKVKDALGADALILSNRPVAGGVEIVALASEEARALDRQRAAEALQPAFQPSIQPSIQPASEPAIPLAQPASAPAPKVAVEPVSADRVEMESLINEIKLMRSMLEEQLSGFAWSEMQRKEPVKLMMMRKMLSAGFSPKLGRQIIDKMPMMPSEKEALDWLGTSLGRNLNISSIDTDIVDRGGVFAIVGPTGVGKTTTTAKLAARCVVRHGAERLALITTDSYRIGAQEQLKIYGRILGVPVHVIKDGADLSYTLSELKDKHLVLIDTIGMSQRDQKVLDQIAMLSGAETEVERILLLNATSGGETLEDVVRAYRGPGLTGAIITKIDEAVSLGATLDVVIRNKLMLHYVTNGQRVPEDLHTANSKYLLHRALKGSKEGSPHKLTETDYPLMVQGAGAYSHAGA